MLLSTRRGSFSEPEVTQVPDHPFFPTFMLHSSQKINLQEKTMITYYLPPLGLYSDNRRSFCRSQNSSSKSFPRSYKHLKIKCIQQSESSGGLRSPSFTASEVGAREFFHLPWRTYRHENPW
jgi:hypothetical protein